MKYLTLDVEDNDCVSRHKTVWGSADYMFCILKEKD